MFNEADVQEVVDGFVRPPGMSRASRLEVVRRLDEQRQRRGQPPLLCAILAARLEVSERTITRYRSAIRKQASTEAATLRALVDADGQLQAAIGEQASVEVATLD